MLKIDYYKKKRIKKIVIDIIIYSFLIVFGFSFVEPLLLSLSKSFMSLSDITNPSVFFIAKEPTLQNYTDIITGFKLFNSLFFSIMYVGITALLQTVSCALVGYGFAKYDFKFKKILLGLVMLVFLIPPQTLMTPSYILMGQLHINNTLLAFFIPAILGQGIKSSIFILIFYSFFSVIPKDLYESAAMEGAKPFQIFYKITLPLVRGAIVITYVLSFVCYWNETYFADLYYRGIKSFPLEISRVISGILSKDPSKMTDIPIYDGLMAAGVILMIIPLIIFYLIIQRQFKQSIENSGLTGQ